MPDKLLKDGLRTSAKIGGVPEFAELLFVRLLLATCHLGRCPWSPDWIRTTALSNRPRKRLTEIAAALETLRRAHLVARYTAHDGTAYLLIPNHGQRLKHAVRSPWPAPPAGPADADGQTFMAMPGDFPIAAQPPPAGIGKRPKAPGGGVRPPPFSSTSSESEADWLDRLRREWPAVDVAAELREAMRKKPRGVERDWFEEHWLPKCSVKVGAQAKALTAAPADACGPGVPDEVWREAAKRVAHATEDEAMREKRLEAVHAGDGWQTFSAEFRRLVRAEIKQNQGRAA